MFIKLKAMTSFEESILAADAILLFGDLDMSAFNKNDDPDRLPLDDERISAILHKMPLPDVRTIVSEIETAMADEYRHYRGLLEFYGCF